MDETGRVPKLRVIDGDELTSLLIRYPEPCQALFCGEQQLSVQNWSVVAFSQVAASQPIPLPIGQASNAFSPHCAWTADSAQLVCVDWSTGNSRLVRAPVPGPGKPEAVLIAGSDAGSPSIARQGGRLAYVHAFGNSNLWRADL